MAPLDKPVGDEREEESAELMDEATWLNEDPPPDIIPPDRNFFPKKLKPRQQKTDIFGQLRRVQGNRCFHCLAELPVRCRFSDFVPYEHRSKDELKSGIAADDWIKIAYCGRETETLTAGLQAQTRLAAWMPGFSFGIDGRIFLRSAPFQCPGGSTPRALLCARHRFVHSELKKSNAADIIGDRAIVKQVANRTMAASQDLQERRASAALAVTVCRGVMQKLAKREQELGDDFIEYAFSLDGCEEFDNTMRALGRTLKDMEANTTTMHTYAMEWTLEKGWCVNTYNNSDMTKLLKSRPLNERGPSDA